MSLVKNVTIILTFGIITGCLTSLGQTFLPEPFKQFANSYSVWLLVSFIAGLLLTSYQWGAGGGAAIQLVALVSYHTVSNLRFDSGFALGGANLLWLVGGISIGPLAGLAGQAIKQRSRFTASAIACMTLLFISEAGWMFLGLHYVTKGYCFISAAAIFLVGMWLWLQKSKIAKYLH